MRVKNIFAILLAVTVSLLTAHSVWAVGYISAVDAYNSAAARTGVIIDVRTVEEHNGCAQAWRDQSPDPTCPNTEPENNGAPQWTDTLTGIVRQAPNVPFWISNITSDTQPENPTEFSNFIEALRVGGIIGYTTPIYLICRSGYRSYWAGLYMEGLGYTNVYTVDGDNNYTDATGGMFEWTGAGLEKHYGWMAPQIFSGDQADGALVSATQPVTFTAGIIQPSWGRSGWGYPYVSRVSLYIDGAERDFITTGASGLGESYTFAPQTLTVGPHTWNVRAETTDFSSAVQVSWNPYADAEGPGDRTVTASVPDISVTDSSGTDNDLEVPFGDIPNTSHTVTVTNLGDVDLKMGQIPYVLDQPGLFWPFSITDNCSNQTIAPSATCTLTILFTDSSPDTGSWGKVIRIPSDDPDESEVVVSMCGTSPGEAWPWTVSGTVPERVDAEAFERVTGSCLPEEGNHTPARPEPVSPEDGETGLETTVEFQWVGVTDPEGDPVTYEISYCEDNEGLQENCVAAKVEEPTLTGRTNRTVYAGLGAGAGLLLFGIVIAGDGRRRRIALLAGMIILTAILLVSCGKGTVSDVGSDVSGGTDTAILSYTVDGLSPDTTYSWQVVASDDKGAASLSYERSFTTGN